MLGPGPDEIRPGLAPGGLVFHVYDRHGVLLLERRLTHRDPIEAAAMADADETLERARGMVHLVAYDGDTGRRVANILHEIDRPG